MALSTNKSHYQILGDFAGKIIPLNDAAEIIKPAKYSDDNKESRKIRFSHAQSRLIAAAHNFVIIPSSIPAILYMHQTECQKSDKFRECSATLRISISKILCEMFARTDFGRLRIGHPLSRTGGYRDWKMVEIAQAAENTAGEFTCLDDRQKLVTNKKFERVIEALTTCSASKIELNEVRKSYGLSHRGATGLGAFKVIQQREIDGVQVNEYGVPVKKYRSESAVKIWNKDFLIALNACSIEAIDNAMAYSNNQTQQRSKDFHALPENKHIISRLVYETERDSALFDVVRSDSKDALRAIDNMQYGHHSSDFSGDHIYKQTPILQPEHMNARHKNLANSQRQPARQNE